MKLAEALIQRSDVHTRIQQLRARIRSSAIVQEGEQPPEDPQALLHELQGLTGEFALLTYRINRSNLEAQLSDGRNLTQAIAERDAIKLRRSVLEEAANAGSAVGARYLRSELRMVPTVNVAQVRGEIDGLAQQYRVLDTQIQAANWAFDLIEN